MLKATESWNTPQEREKYSFKLLVKLCYRMLSFIRLCKPRLKCSIFFRNRGLYEYLVFSDLDERVLPFKNSILHVLRQLDSPNTSAFGFTNAFYPSRFVFFRTIVHTFVNLSWELEPKKLASVYPGWQRIPAMREATNILRDNRFDPLVLLSNEGIS